MKQIYCDAYGLVDVATSINPLVWQNARYRGTQIGGCGDVCMECDRNCNDRGASYDFYALDFGDGDMVAVQAGQSEIGGNND